MPEHRLPVRSLTTRPRRYFATLLALAGLGSCAHATETTPDASRPGGRRTPTQAGAQGTVMGGLAARELALVPPGTQGPYLGASGEHRVAVWVADKAGTRSWFSAAVGAAGPPASPLLLGPAPAQVELVSVAKAGPLEPGGDRRPGFVVVASSRSGARTSLSVLALGLEGELYAPAVTLVETENEISWLHALAVKDGTLVLWAVRNGDRADVQRVLVDRNATAVGGIDVVFEGVRAWQVQPTARGAAVAVVGAVPKEARFGDVRLQILDERGRAVGPPKVVEASPNADLDMDMVRMGPDLLLAWSDRRRVDSRLVLAVVDEGGETRRPPAFPSGLLGEQALLTLVPPAAKGRPHVVWEDLDAQTDEARVLIAAEVDAKADLGRVRAKLFVPSSPAPSATPSGSVEWRSTALGLAALAPAPLCAREAHCTDASVVPTYVEWGSGLQRTASEPLLLDALAGAPAALAWGLSCGQDGCIALAAPLRSPAPVFVVELARRSDAWRSPGATVEPDSPPRATALETLHAPESVADVGLLELGDHALAAWLTDFDPRIPYERPTKPAPDGRFAPVRALLEIAKVGGGRAEPPTVISLRAHTPGGVALASRLDSGGPGLLAWTAIDGGHAQVFTTLVSAQGRKVRQRMFTNAPAEASEVAAVAGADGWFVGWVSTHGEASELRVAKVGRALERVGPELRVTQGGEASGPALASGAQGLLAVWSASATSDEEVQGDIVARMLDQHGVPTTGPIPLTQNPKHEHSPRAVRYGDGYVVAWVSDPAPGTSGASELAVAELDGRGGLRRTPTSTPLPGVSLRELDLACSANTCRLVLRVDSEERAEFWAVSGRPGAALEPKQLYARENAVAHAQGLALGTEGALYGDSAGPKAGRVRFMQLDWGNAGL